MRARHISLIACFLSFVSAVAFGTEISIAPAIDVEVAKSLIVHAYPRATRESLDYDSHMDYPFLVFGGLNMPGANGFYGMFAVNPWTGDVWNLWGCHKLSTPELRSDQAAIRRNFTRRERNQLERLSALKPFCTFED